MNKKQFLLSALAVCITAIAIYLVFRPADSSVTQQKSTSIQRSEITSVAENLDTPWAIATLPDGRILITERAGIITILGPNGVKIAVADVVERGEGGLLGLTLHPDFETNSQLYIYKTTGQNNIVERYKLEGSQLVEQQVIVGDIPAANVHNGGEIEFGPEGKLYITTGDAATESQAQDKNSLAGKILRVNDDGSVPADNPFETKVWSYGHRNPQGLAWDDQQRLWSTEHGPSGLQSGFDELNLIQKGGNYGWPIVRGNEQREGLIAPKVQSGNRETWAPAGLTYARGSLYFTGLRGKSLYQAKITGEEVRLTSHFAGEYGRLRAVVVNGQDLLISTSNRDGRGTPSAKDDQILRVPLKIIAY